MSDNNYPAHEALANFRMDDKGDGEARSLDLDPMT